MPKKKEKKAGILAAHIGISEERENWVDHRRIPEGLESLPLSPRSLSLLGHTSPVADRNGWVRRGIKGGKKRENRTAKGEGINAKSGDENKGGMRRSVPEARSGESPPPGQHSTECDFVG